MRFIFKLMALVLFFSLIGIPASIIFLCIDEKPLIKQNAELTFNNVKKTKNIIDENRPKRLYSNQKKTLQLSENEINMLLSYAISHGLDSTSLFAQAKIIDNTANIFLSLKLPKQFFGEYLNLVLSIEEKGRLFELATCQIGQLKIPKEIIIPLISFVHRSLLHSNRYADLWSHAENIDQINFQFQRLTVRYRLNYGTIEKIKETGRSFLLTDDHQQRLIGYYNHLSMLTHTHKQKKNVTIDILKGLISFAQKNTETSNDPILENTTAIQVLSLYATGTRLDQLLKKEYRNSIKPAYRTDFKFYNRSDLPKHFFVSAALAVSTGSKFANLIGLVKEVEDSDGGSGFSFADLAADKAGVRFGELAITDPNSARLFQKRIGRIKKQANIMPPISNLPEGISQLEFKAVYKDFDSKTYQLINVEIESRLLQCKLYND